MSHPQSSSTPYARNTSASPAPVHPEPTAETRTATPGPHAPNATAQDAITPAPVASTTAHGATTPGATTTLPSAEIAPVGGQTLSFNDKLNASDRYWKFKLAMRAVLIVFGIIGIGTVGWAFSSIATSELGFSDQYWELWPPLVTFPLSVFWCSLCVFFFMVRKRPIHPGVRVAIDLILWLSFIATALSVTAALIDLQSWGANGELGWEFDSSSGSYQLLNNGTWVWQDYDNGVTYARDCDHNSTVSSPQTSSYSSYSDLNFKDCSEQDAYVNWFWQAKRHRATVLTLATVCQYLGLVLHFVLFVWACVDTHRRRRSKVSADAEKLAASIVQTMIQNGAIMPPPGQTHMRPAPGQPVYYQLPPQQQAYPLANMYPHSGPVPQQQQQQQQQQQGQQQYQPQPMMQGSPQAGPSTEKSAGPRYA